MKKYLVGGAVRDTLLGLTPKDKDYVVIDSTAEEMISLGFQQVGQAFPVFLHPETGDEYALARKEKKTGVGRNSFVCDIDQVTLQEDLLRRDLTINAMAMSENGEIIDFFGGRKDLEDKILRHVSPAFEEDPLRVLRVARFAARYPGFRIHPTTLEIMKNVVNSDEFKTLSKPRVYSEMKTALLSPNPSVFFGILRSVGGLEFYFPELFKLIGVSQTEKYHPEGDAWTHTMLTLDAAASISPKLTVRFAALLHDIGKGVTPTQLLPSHHDHEKEGVPLVKTFCDRFDVPVELRKAALIATKYHIKMMRLEEMKSSSIVDFLHQMGAFQVNDNIDILDKVSIANEVGKLKSFDSGKTRLNEYFQIVNSINFNDAVKTLKDKSLNEKLRTALSVKKLRELRVLKLKEYRGK